MFSTVYCTGWEISLTEHLLEFNSCWLRGQGEIPLCIADVRFESCLSLFPPKIETSNIGLRLWSSCVTMRASHTWSLGHLIPYISFVVCCFINLLFKLVLQDFFSPSFDSLLFLIIISILVYCSVSKRKKIHILWYWFCICDIPCLCFRCRVSGFSYQFYSTWWKCELEHS